MNEMQAQPDGSHFRDARAAHDMAELRFSVFPESDNRKWALIRITPAPDSGASMYADAMIESETGRRIDVHTLQPIPPGQEKLRIVKQGTWQVLDEFERAGGMTSGKYSWMEMPQTHTRRVAPEDLYSPFVGGGVILCGFDPAAEGAAQFQPIYQIPENWIPQFRPAWAQLLSELASGPEPSSPQGIARLKGLIAGPNPVLATFAVRDFIRASQEELEWLTDMATHDGREAVFTYLLIDSTDPPERWKKLVENSVFESHAIASGAFAAAMLGTSGGVQSRARKLLQDLREKRGASAGPYIGEIFELLGIV